MERNGSCVFLVSEKTQAHLAQADSAFLARSFGLFISVHFRLEMGILTSL